jgi:hypothetical protein
MISQFKQQLPYSWILSIFDYGDDEYRPLNFCFYQTFSTIKSSKLSGKVITFGQVPLEN